jgi:hypothetical protein
MMRGPQPSTLPLALLCLSLVLPTACEDPDFSPVEEVLGTAIPTAFAATAAMAAVSEGGFPCVGGGVGCATFPCFQEFIVVMGEECAFPLGDNADGQVGIEGTWTGPDQATLAAVFADLQVDGRSLVILEMALMNASRHGDEITVAYVEEDVLALSEGDDGESRAEVKQSAWTVNVATNGTPGDTADDVLTISGSKQQVVGEAITQVAVANAVMAPSCRKNPVEGTATIQDVEGVAPDSLTLLFHEECDGKVDLLVSAGLSSAASSGQPADIHLLADP